MKHTISVLVENYAGVLSKISGLFTRRGFNIDSLAVGITDDPAVSRITIVVNGDDSVIEQVEKQLNKLIPVIKVKTLAEGEFVSRQLSLFKVSATVGNRAELMKISELMNARIIDVSAATMTFEFTDTVERTETLEGMLRQYGIREVVRTGTVAIEKGTNIVRSSKKNA